MNDLEILLDDPAPDPRADLERRIVMAMGLFPEDRLFTPAVPADRTLRGVPGGAHLPVLPPAQDPGQRVHLPG